MTNEEQATNYEVDKTGWDDGPWMTEPDRVQWQHAGYACLLLRHPHGGYLCGYVGVDAQHPYYGKHPLHEDLSVYAHRGLNYGAKCSGVICHVPEPGMPADVWWLGFDMGHSMDLAPGRVSRERAMGMPLFESQGFKETYRTVAYAQRETERLAEQLRALADAGASA